MVVKGDTIVAFTPSQAKKIQLTKIELDECTEFSDSLRERIQKDNLLITNQQFVIKGFERERSLSSMIIQNDSIINNEYQMQVNKLEKNLNRARTGNKILGGTVLTGLGILIGSLVAK